MNHCTGFSLVELAACVLLAAILALVAMPGMAGLVQSNRAAATSNQVLAVLMQARMEALKRRGQVALCPSFDAETCVTTTDWSRGFISFEDRNRNGRREPHEPVIRVVQAPDLNGMLLQGSRGRDHLAFRLDGRASGSNATLRLCTRGAALARKIIISSGGRARIESPAVPEPC